MRPIQRSTRIFKCPQERVGTRAVQPNFIVVLVGRTECFSVRRETNFVDDAVRLVVRDQLRYREYGHLDVSPCAVALARNTLFIG